MKPVTRFYVGERGNPPRSSTGSSAPHRSVHHPSRGSQHERYGSVPTRPNVGFAATRPASGRLCPPHQALPHTSTSPPPSRQYSASSGHRGTSSIPFEPSRCNRAEDAGASIAIASENYDRPGPLRGFLPRGLFAACPHASSRAHSNDSEGRHRITLNDNAYSFCPKPAFRTQLDGGASMNEVAYQPSADLAYLVARGKKLQNWLKDIRSQLDEESAFINLPLSPASYSVTDFIGLWQAGARRRQARFPQEKAGEGTLRHRYYGVLEIDAIR